MVNYFCDHVYQVLLRTSERKIPSDPSSRVGSGQRPLEGSLVGWPSPRARNKAEGGCLPLQDSTNSSFPLQMQVFGLVLCSREASWEVLKINKQTKMFFWTDTPENKLK